MYVNYYLLYDTCILRTSSLYLVDFFQLKGKMKFDYTLIFRMFSYVFFA